MSAQRFRFSQLFGCALHGHVNVGLDAADVRPEDALLVREFDGLRWHRCLRCDSWTVLNPPENPTRPTVPTRDEIALPLRGRPLRDRYLLRLIALDRAIHVVVLVGVAIALFLFVSHRSALRGDYDSIMNSLLGASGGPSALRGLLGRFHKFFLYNPGHLDEIGFVALGYAALEATEMVGLWFAQRWAEYLTLLSTALFLPLEIYELTTKVSILKIVILVINAAIVIYLLFAKRLFGLRGGQRAEDERRRATSGWSAIEQATPAAQRPLPEQHDAEPDVDVEPNVDVESGETPAIRTPASP